MVREVEEDGKLKLATSLETPQRTGRSNRGFKQHP